MQGQIEMDLVAALLLVFEDHRQFGQADMAFLHVVIAANGAQIDDFGVFGQCQHHFVDIG